MRAMLVVLVLVAASCNGSLYQPPPQTAQSRPVTLDSVHADIEQMRGIAAKLEESTLNHSRFIVDYKSRLDASTLRTAIRNLEDFQTAIAEFRRLLNRADVAIAGYEFERSESIMERANDRMLRAIHLHYELVSVTSTIAVHANVEPPPAPEFSEAP